MPALPPARRRWKARPSPPVTPLVGPRRCSVTDRSAVAPRIGATDAHARHRVDRNAVRVAGELAEIRPAICRVSPPLELLHGRFGETPFDVEQVARVADGEAPREPARHLERLLDVKAEIDEAHIALQVDLRLAVGAHAAEYLPGATVLQRDRRDQRVHRALARLEGVGMLWIERKVGRAILQDDA